jgi:transmembrane sensor
LVTLFQGSVSLEAGGQEAYLHPGERASVSKKYRTLDITSADMFYDSFWASESVRFEAKSLRYITRYLEKWYNVKIEVDPSIPDSQAYTFTIKDESLEVILRIMSRINPISYMFDGNDHVKITHVEPSKK